MAANDVTSCSEAELHTRSLCRYDCVSYYAQVRVFARVTGCFGRWGHHRDTLLIMVHGSQSPAHLLGISSGTATGSHARRTPSATTQYAPLPHCLKGACICTPLHFTFAPRSTRLSAVKSDELARFSAQYYGAPAHRAAQAKTLTYA